MRGRRGREVVAQDDDDDRAAFADTEEVDAADEEFVSHPEESEGGAGVLGEFDAEGEEDISFNSTACEKLTPLPVSKELKAMIDARIGALFLLDELDRERQKLLAKPGLADNAKMYLLQQNAEWRALPEKEAVQEKKAALDQKIGKIREQLRAQQIDGYEGQKIEAPSDDVEQVWAMSLKQYSLLLQRSEVLPALLEACETYLKSEPFYNLLMAFHYPARPLFSLAVFQLALENWLARLNEKRKELLKQSGAASESARGFFNKGKKDAADEKARLDAQLENCTLHINNINREIAALQKNLVSEFWRIYEFCACLFVSGKLPDKSVPIVRAFLRYGLLGHAPWFIAPEVQKYIMLDCVQDVKNDYDPAMSACNIVYADEYLRFIVLGHYTPSIDENLELTARNTPEWSADKALRRIAYSRTRAHVLKERRSDLIQRISQLRAKQEEMVLLRAKLIKGAKDYKKRNAELAQSIQHCKVEAARFERVVQRIDEKEASSLIERATMARERLHNSGVNITAFHIARKEAAGIHRVCRLCAKLKDPFLPFVLRDNFKPESGVVNSRAQMRKALEYVENCDRNIFNDLLVNSRKENQRIHLRCHPVFLITPSCGFLGYSWNPRVGVEAGKLVFPGYCPRPGIAERMLYNTLADFRWDTSKAAAGVDLLTSDTLVAAYSAVRWDYRKKKRENREKALIFNELNDRQNWRRHYELYLQSAQDSGRKLFYKNVEVYEVVVKYIGLPEGCEKLRR